MVPVSQSVTTYWCVPCGEDASRYTSIIKSLADVQGSPVFQPHLTLGTFPEALADVKDVTDALSDLILEPESIGTTDVFTKSLFVRFGRSKRLLTARKQMESLPNFRFGRSFDPHISLCYGAPPLGSSERLDVLELLNHPVRFDRLVSVRLAAPVNDHSDIKSWRVTDTFPIDG